MGEELVFLLYLGRTHWMNFSLLFPESVFNCSALVYWYLASEMYSEHLVHLRWAFGMMFGTVTNERAVLLAFLLKVCFIQYSGLESDSKLAEVKGCLLVTLWVLVLSSFISGFVSLSVVDTCVRHNPTATCFMLWYSDSDSCSQVVKRCQNTFGESDIYLKSGIWAMWLSTLYWDV